MATEGGCSTQPLDAAEMSAWHALIRAHSRVVRRLEAELEAEHGLSLPAYEVLAHLSEAGDQRLRMTELATHAVLTPSGLTRLVDKLAREGLVERQRCGADARVVYAVLTPLGMARLVAAYPTHVRGVREHYLDWLSAAQKDAVSDALGELAGARCREAEQACLEAELAADVPVTA
ncbi:MAG TPA: MarR family transcriptional regulator [Mycobacteriales bacterium]|nr:MarR family transcriptional regulator [Mycobacteriales bacterium]